MIIANQSVLVIIFISKKFFWWNRLFFFIAREANSNGALGFHHCRNWASGVDETLRNTWKLDVEIVAVELLMGMNFQAYHDNFTVKTTLQSLFKQAVHIYEAVCKPTKIIELAQRCWPQRHQVNARGLKLLNSTLYLGSRMLSVMYPVLVTRFA